MKTLHLSIIVTLLVTAFFGIHYVFAQNVTNSTYSMPPNAIRTPNGGWITPLQTTDQNGKNLTIHYETGIPVSGSVIPPGPPPIMHMTIEANSKLYEKGDTITISGKEDNYLLQKYGNDLTLSIDDTRTRDRWCCDDFKSSPDGSFYFSFKMPDMFQSSDNYNVRVSPKNSTDEYGIGFLYYLSLPYPLEQLKSGISASDVKCSDNLVHIIKAEDNSPACVKPDSAGILIKRGWAQSGIIPSGKEPHEVFPFINSNDTGKPLVNQDNQTSSALRLYLSTDSAYANPAEAVGVDISLNNTSSTPLTLTKADNWPRNDLSSGSCSNLPFGMAILKGYYTEQNMTGASSLVIYQNIPCPNPASIKSYTFQPLSSKATQECDSLFSCPVLADMKIHLKVDGFMDNNGQHRPFNVGTYTIVSGDEWGHVTISHFTEEYATLAGVK